MTAAANPAPMTTTAEPLVLRRDAGRIAILTLNRPRAANALSRAMIAALQDDLDRIANDPGVTVVVIEAAGKVFCAGHDLKEMRADPRPETHAELMAACSRMMSTIMRLPKPVIASVHGIATAAGCQLVASCDLAVATESARFATPGVNIGLFCSTPMVALSRAVNRKHALEMLLTGEMISAERAERIGLVNRVVADERLAEETLSLARTIAAKSHYTLAIGKETFQRQSELGLDDAYALAAEVMVKNLQAVDAAEGIDAFIEKRTPVWRGC